MKSELLLAAFTPSIMSQEVLESIFVRRESLATRLMDNLRTSATTRSKRHALLVGPRGIGKTHLVSLLYHRVKDDDTLRKGLCIAWLREETWEVASFLDLLESILRALAAEYEDKELRAALVGLKALPAETAGARAECLLLDFLADRVLLLIVENLDDLFAALEEFGQRQLRAFLQNHTNTVLLATTPSLFYGVSDHDAPFFNFFNVTHLDELSLDDAVQLLEKIADLREDAELAAFLRTETARNRLEAVQHLAGGHPRIWILFAGIVTEEALDELVPIFLQMLDDLTPYYQSRMKELPPQQRKIVTVLCTQRGAVPVKEIAEACRLSHQATASQLHGLREMAFVRNEATGRESWYELNEPLMRLVFEIKESRGRPLRLIVDFLRRWYSRSELLAKYADTPEGAGIARQHIKEALDTTLTRPDYDKLMQTGEFQKVLDTFEEAGRAVPVELWFYRGNDLFGLKQYFEALESYDRAISLDPRYATFYYNRGETLCSLQRYTEALESFERAIELEPEYAFAHNSRGVALAKLKRYEEAVDSFYHAIKLDDKFTSAYYNYGEALARLRHDTAALESVDRALELDPELAIAYHLRGYILCALSRYNEAIESYDRAIHLNPHDATAYNNRGATFANLKRYTEAIHNYDRAIELMPEHGEFRFNRAEMFLTLHHWVDFLAELQQGFSVAEATHAEGGGDTATFCRLMLADIQAQYEWRERVTAITRLYAEHQALKWLGNGLAESISALFEQGITNDIADAWNAAWQESGKEQADLAIPLRLLDAAVQWHRKPDRRILLRLPVEERRVLEKILPSQK